MTFGELRQEYEQVVIGDLIFGIVLELTGLICRKYPELVYNHGLPWDEHSMSDLAQEVVLNQLLNEGQLDYIFAVASTVESVRRLMSRNVKRALHRRRTVTPIDRLVKRIAAMADAGRVERVPGTSTCYRPVGSTAEWAPITPQQETTAANAASHVPVLYSRRDAARESQIYTAPALDTVVAALFSVCPVLNEQDFHRIFQKILTPWAPTDLVPIEEEHEPTEERMIDVTIDDVDAAARIWVDSLTIEECVVYYYRSRDLPDAVAADRIKKSRPTVVNIKKRILESAGSRLLADLDSRLHLDAVKLAQEHCARRIGDSL